MKLLIHKSMLMFNTIQINRSFYYNLLLIIIIIRWIAKKRTWNKQKENNILIIIVASVSAFNVQEKIIRYNTIFL